MTRTTPSTSRGEQLALLDASDVPVQFRLSRETRLLGLAHVAEIRRLLQTQRGDDQHRAA